ncbi:MAG: hypothetical protein GY705_14390 [Bacteroidetes bacterium]|nr:hypothetical protein [Bacteroidota bacterium]
MLIFNTSSKNEDVQILENDIVLAELIYENISHFKANATFYDNRIAIKLKPHLGSLLGLHKMDIFKNGTQNGRINFPYFGGAKIYLMNLGVEKVYKVKAKRRKKCVLRDSEDNTLIELMADFKILRLKWEYKAKLIEELKMEPEQRIELLLYLIFCTRILLSRDSFGD